VRARLLAGSHFVAAPHILERARRRWLCQLSREQVVPRIPAGDVHDLPAQPDLLDVLEEDDLHG
jgi:hypothetical protein